MTGYEQHTSSVNPTALPWMQTPGGSEWYAKPLSDSELIRNAGGGRMPCQDSVWQRFRQSKLAIRVEVCAALCTLPDRISWHQRIFCSIYFSLYRLTGARWPPMQFLAIVVVVGYILLYAISVTVYEKWTLEHPWFHQPSARHCHSAAPPSPLRKCFNMDGEEVSAK